MTDSAISNFPVHRLGGGQLLGTDRHSAAAPCPRGRTSAELSQYREGPLSIVIRLIFSVGIAALMLIGWLGRDDNGLTPKSGLGYWLGIAGSVLMLLLLVY